MPGEPPGSSDPLDPAGLVGRAAEAAAIRRMLDGAALVTVTGLPGVGKTAVSLAAHIEPIYGKIGVSSRVQLASWLRTRPPE
jgi:hypothetical protein